MTALGRAVERAAEHEHAMGALGVAIGVIGVLLLAFGEGTTSAYLSGYASGVAVMALLFQVVYHG